MKWFLFQTFYTGKWFKDENIKGYLKAWWRKTEQHGWKLFCVFFFLIQTDLWPNQLVWGHLGEELCSLRANLWMCAVTEEVEQVDQSTWGANRLTWASVHPEPTLIWIKTFRKKKIALHRPLAIASLTIFVLEVSACKVSSTICRPKWYKKHVTVQRYTEISTERGVESTHGKAVTLFLFQSFLLTGGERVQQQQEIGQHQRFCDVANAFLVWCHSIYNLQRKLQWLQCRYRHIGHHGDELSRPRSSTSNTSCCTLPAPWTRNKEKSSLKWPMHSDSEPEIMQREFLRKKTKMRTLT